MTVLIQIHYFATEIQSRAYRQGEFRLKGKSKEQVALEFWEWIKKETPIELELEKIICDSEDITDLVKQFEDQEHL
jgi:hypothetical protein